MKKGIWIINSAGRVTSTAGPDLLHTLSTGRVAKVRKIKWYNPTAGNITFIIGTLDRNPGGAAFVNCLNTVVAIAGLDGFLEPNQIEDYLFQSDRTPTAAGLTGDIYLQASAINLVVTLTVEESQSVALL